MSIKHDISLQTQTASSNCVQTATSQFLSFYGTIVSPDAIEQHVPVRLNANNKPMGALLPDIGTWLKGTQENAVEMHVFDVQIIDRSWINLSQKALLSEIIKIQEHGVSTARTPYASILIDAYVAFLQAGGVIKIAKCTNVLLQKLLLDGPVLTIVNFNYIYDYPRSKYDPTSKEYLPDPIDGKVIEHAIVLTGFSGNQYYYNDPDAEVGGQHTIQDDVLIGSICAAQLNSDNYLLTINK